MTCELCRLGTSSDILGANTCPACAPGTAAPVEGMQQVRLPFVPMGRQFVQSTVSSLSSMESNFALHGASDITVDMFFPPVRPMCVGYVSTRARRLRLPQLHGRSIRGHCSTSDLRGETALCTMLWSPGLFAQDWSMCYVPSANVGPNLVYPQECGPGRFSEHDGSSMCAVCPPGTFTDRMGRADCLLCPAGKFTADSGQVRTTM